MLRNDDSDYRGGTKTRKERKRNKREREIQGDQPPSILF